MSGAPNLWGYAIRAAAAVGLTGMLCCVAPMVLFAVGLMGGVYAISFADWFYTPDGAPGAGAWVLRAAAFAVGVWSIWRYQRSQQQCDLTPNRQRTNLVLLCFLISTLGVGFFRTLEATSSWYFDAYIVPAQQSELGLDEQG